MSDLVKRLRGGKCPLCKGFGEMPYCGEMVRCLCQDRYEAPISMEQRIEAADRIEALEGEVRFLRDAGALVEANFMASEARAERLEGENAALKKRLEIAERWPTFSSATEAAEAAEAAEARAERLRVTLRAIEQADYYGCVSEFAAKALEDDKQ